jgi:hypothetical protein
MKVLFPTSSPAFVDYCFFFLFLLFFLFDFLIFIGGHKGEGLFLSVEGLTVSSSTPSWDPGDPGDGWVCQAYSQHLEWAWGTCRVWPHSSRWFYFV